VAAELLYDRALPLASPYKSTPELRSSTLPPPLPSPSPLPLSSAPITTTAAMAERTTELSISSPELSPTPIFFSVGSQRHHEVYYFEQLPEVSSRTRSTARRPRRGRG